MVFCVFGQLLQLGKATKGGINIFSTIRSKMAVQFSILFLVCLCVTGGILFQKTKSMLQDTTIKYMQGTSGQLSRQIDKQLDMVASSVNTIISNWSLQSILNEPAPFLYYSQIQQIQSIIKDASSSNDSLAAVQIFAPKYGYMGFNNSPIQPYEIRKVIDQLTDEGSVPFENVQWLAERADLSGNRSPYIYGIRRMTNFIGQEPLGFVMVLVKTQDLFRDFGYQENTLQENVLLYDDLGNVIASKGSLDEGAARYYFERTKHLPSGGSLVDHSPFGENLVAHHSLNQSTWHTLVIQPVSSLTEKISYMNTAWLWASIIVLLVIFICSWILSLRITLPIRRMQRAMKKVEIGEFNLDLEETKVKEINELSYSFNRMSRRIDTLIHQVYEVEIARQTSELRELQAQINPHFLFNTLDSVYWLLVMKDQEEAAGLIVALSRLFRYSTEVHRDVVTISEEFEHIANYMRVQQIRFKSIHLKSCIAPEARDLSVLKLMIQPLVENAIQHGLEPSGRGGQVEIRADIDFDGKLVISVTDDGVGMEADLLEGLRNLLTKPERGIKRPAESIALENIYRRIRLYYGDAGTMDIDSTPKSGTAIIIRLPASKPVFINGGENRNHEDHCGG